MTSVLGNEDILIAGLTNLLGPANFKGEALSEKIGSNKIVILPLKTRKLAWPIQNA